MFCQKHFFDSSLWVRDPIYLRQVYLVFDRKGVTQRRKVTGAFKLETHASVILRIVTPHQYVFGISGKAIDAGCSAYARQGSFAEFGQSAEPANHDADFAFR